MKWERKQKITESEESKIDPSTRIGKKKRQDKAGGEFISDTWSGEGGRSTPGEAASSGKEAAEEKGGGGEEEERGGPKGKEMVMPKSLIAGSLKSNILEASRKGCNRRGVWRLRRG